MPPHPPSPASRRPRTPPAGALARYVGVGATATAVHVAMLGLLVEAAGVPAGWGSAAGAVLGAQVAYFGNRRFTFAHAGPVRLAWTRFQVTALAGGALGAAIVAVAVAHGLHWLPAQAFATTTVLLATFAINRRWSFGR